MADTEKKNDIVEEDEIAAEALETADEAVAESEENAEQAKNDSATKTEKKSKKAEDKPGFFKRLGARLKKFWKNYKSELKKITWYSRKQTFASTLLVLVCVVVSAAVIGVLDWGFSNLIQLLAKI